MHFEETVTVKNGPDHLVHVVRHVFALRHDRVQRFVHAIGWIIRCDLRRVLGVVLRQVAQQHFDQFERSLFIIRQKVRHTTAGVVHRGAAKVLEADVFTRHALDHFRSGDDHKAALARHDDEVGERGRVHRAASARAKDDGYLRYHARGHHVAREYLAICSQAAHAFLDARAA